MDTESLTKFLLAANDAGYAKGDDKKWTKEEDGSTTIAFGQGEWTSHDNFFGGEPYGGRVVVSYKGKPVWMMVYYGWVAEGVVPDTVYAVLREALKVMPSDAPFRGPGEFINQDFVYSNSWVGDVERYTGVEKITKGKQLLYEAHYMGGYVDRSR